MTLEDLADMTADSLSKITPEERYKICAPYFTVTRPEQVRALRGSVASAPTISLEHKQKLIKLESMGVDISLMAKALKKQGRQ